MEADYLPVYSIPEDTDEFRLVCEEGFAMIRPCPFLSVSGAIIVQLIDKLIYFQSFGCYGMNYLKRYLNRVKRSRFKSFPKLTSIIEQIEENTASQAEYREALEKSKSLYNEILEFSKELISPKTAMVDENDSELNMFSREFSIDFWIYSSDNCQKISNSIIPNPILITLFQIDKETEIEFSVLHHNLEIIGDNDPSFSFPYLVENKQSKTHKEEQKNPKIAPVQIQKEVHKNPMQEPVQVLKEEHKNQKQIPVQIQKENLIKKSDKAMIGIRENLLSEKEEKGLQDVWGIEDGNKSKVQKLENKNQKQEKGLPDVWDIEDGNKSKLEHKNPKQEKGLSDVWGDIEDENKSKVQKLEHKKPKQEEKGLPDAWDIEDENKSKVQKNPKQEHIKISIESPTRKPEKTIIDIGETLLPPIIKEDLPDILNIGSGNKGISHPKVDDLAGVLQSEPVTKGNPYEFLIQNKKEQEKVQNIQSSQIAIKKERSKPKANLQYNPRNFMLPQNSGKLYEEHKIPFNEEIY
ncbi:unnamed protein product [Blepharisma stoltei]|uniref:Uncharacterized protein n=1 Tax=Blepharisma stoltei TaxID=1481888 RepID=A0AAU9J1Q9_9CILI|nr:unnamed protein product [Blepharisma stoltei]